MLSGFRGELLSVGRDPCLDPTATRHEPDGLLVVEDGIVVARGHFAEVSAQFLGLPIEEMPGMIVPGFIDAHVHYPQLDCVASYGTKLLDWLERYIFPAEMAFASRAHADAVAAAFLDELLRNGTTSALVFPTVHEQSVDALFDAALARGMRMISGKVLMDLGPDQLRDDARDERGVNEGLIRRWRGRGRLGYAITPRFALTSSDAQLAHAGALLAAHPEALLHTHLAENETECAQVSARFPDAADYLDAYDRFGLVGGRSVFAHGIHLTGRSCNRLAQARAGIAVCPSSNLFLGSGFFDFGQADAHGVRLGLGSDIGAGTTLSMLRTGGYAYEAALARNHQLDPLRALYLATAGSASLLHIDGQVGALEPGQEADFAVLDCAATPLLSRRTARASLADRLFALQVLGDDRAIVRTYIMGRCAWDRDKMEFAHD